MKVLLFELGDGAYSLAVEHVHSVRKPLPVTRVPGVGGALDGVFNLRSSVVPLVNLAVLLGAARTKLVTAAGGRDKRLRYVVIESEGRLRAFPVDNVIGLFEVEDDALEAGAVFDPRLRMYYAGLLRIEDRDCVSLKPDALFETDQF